MTNRPLIKFERDTLSEFIFEIRYKPNPILLDSRGEFAEGLIKAVDLPNWRITENRIDVHDHNKDPELAENRYFVSFKNAGCVSRNESNYRHFIEKCRKIINFWFTREEAFESKKVLVSRIGVKFRYGDKYSGPFDELLSTYTEKYLEPKNSISSIFNAKINDIGGFLNLSTKENGIQVDLQTMSGPMKNSQSKQFFPHVDLIPETILYFEIDSSIKPNDILHYKKIENYTEDLIRRNWTSHTQLLNILDENNG